MNSLNPVLNVESQFRDVIEQHERIGREAVDERIAELLRMVEIDPSFMRYYPHELSGRDEAAGRAGPGAGAAATLRAP